MQKEKDRPDPSVYLAHLTWWQRLRRSLSTDPDDIPTDGDPEAMLRRRRLLRAGLLALAAVLFSVFGGMPLYRGWQAWESRREAATARRALDGGKWNEAWVSAQEAVRWVPTEPTSLRTLALVAARTERWDRAVAAWEELARSGTKLTADDHRARAAALVAVGNAPAALQSFDALGPESEPSDAVLRARALTLARREPEALRALSALLRAPNTPAVPALAAVRELMTLNKVPREDLLAATVVIKRIVQSRGAAAFAAAEFAASCLGGAGIEEGGLGEPLTAREIILAVRALPEGGLPARLLALELELRADPSQRADLMAAAVQETARIGTLEALEQVAAWLLQHRDAPRVLELLPPERAKESGALGSSRIEALVAAGKLREARVEAESQQYPIEPDLEQALLARILAAAGDAKASEKRWAGALAAAGQDRPRLRRLALMARDAGAELTAEAAEASVAALDRKAVIAER